MDFERFLPDLSAQLNISPRQIAAVARLLEEGCTIPFIARYRKEAHGNLNEVQIADIQERLTALRELEARREAILSSIIQQGKLTEELKGKILGCKTRAALEDLYLPYRPKRRTRAGVARERGLQPLADLILAQGGEDPQAAAEPFADPAKELPDVAAALKGARDIVAEAVAEHPDVRGFARDWFAKAAVMRAQVSDPPPAQPTKYEMYYDFSEPVAEIPSHRFFAIKRGEAEGVLRVSLEVDTDPVLRKALEVFALREGSPWADALRAAAQDGIRRLLTPSIELDVAVDLKQRADREAVEVFAENLRHLLLQAPLGERAVIGIDPGIRTGCKVAALDATGKFLENLTIYPGQGPQGDVAAAVELMKLIARHRPYAIAIGNGTAGRETERFVRQLLKRTDNADVIVVSVNEAGASVYSASDVAREEFPELDLTVRGAISIGRRLQDPLAELVKITPASIGVGQYQHDVNQSLLTAKLDEVVVSCVNRVGVELNTASAPLLTRVSGIGPTLAKRIVAYRDEQSPAWAPRPSSSAPASSASARAPTPSTAPPSTPSATTSSAAWPTTPASPSTAWSATRPPSPRSPSRPTRATPSACPPSVTSSTSCASPAATPAPPSSRPPSARTSPPSRTSAPAWSSRASSPTSPPSAPSSTSASTRTASSTSPSSPTASSATRTRS